MGQSVTIFVPEYQNDPNLYISDISHTPFIRDPDRDSEPEGGRGNTQKTSSLQFFFRRGTHERESRTKRNFCSRRTERTRDLRGGRVDNFFDGSAGDCTSTQLQGSWSPPFPWRRLHVQAGLPKSLSLWHQLFGSLRL